jgi:enoyl-CoA hydratase/carnithine racemase
MEDQSMSTQAAVARAEAEPILLRDDADGVATLTLNRPGARNALSRPLIDAVQDALDAIRDDRSVKVVVLAGNGPGFCAGHDLKEVRANPRREAHVELFKACSRMMLSITHLPKPVIARVHGIATAAGCQLAATCDLAVASTEARFATPGVNIGLFCSTPMVALSRAVGRKQAMEMLLTGDMFPAEHALAIGLVNRVVAPDKLDETVYGLANQIAGKSPLTLAIGKEAFYRQVEMGLEAAYAYTNEVAADNMMARDAEEGIDAFIEKREPEWRGE